MTISSMTGFARSDGAPQGLDARNRGNGPFDWAWELRSVNGRGLELRFRLPPGFDSLEPALRDAAGKALKRGNVNATLTVRREEQPRLTLDAAALDHMLDLALTLAGRIPGAAPPRPEALLALPGVLRQAGAAAADEAESASQAAALLAGFQAALDSLVVSRVAEGTRLAAVLDTLLTEIEALCTQAAREAADQPALHQARLTDALAALLRDHPGLPAERIAQEVALLASRSDVREELDRLSAHIGAARALMAEGAAIGRRFDFLVQEFNREANTLCSKSASIALTATGLRLKAAVEQLREQAANIE